jgi:hypothetical protein
MQKIKALETKINKRTGYDNMSIKATFPTGAFIRWSIGRSGESMNFKLDPSTLDHKAFSAIFVKYLTTRPGNNTEKFAEFEALAKRAASLEQAIKLMQAKLAVK